MHKHECELGIGKFQAKQAHGRVTVHAEGETPSNEYDLWLEKLPLEVFPPIFALRFCRRPGPSNPVLTPFAVHSSFVAHEVVESVRVIDAAGEHEVRVEQAPERAIPGKQPCSQGDELAYDLTLLTPLVMDSGELGIYCEGLARTAPSVGTLVLGLSKPPLAQFELRATRGPLQIISPINASYLFTPEQARSFDTAEVKSDLNTLRVNLRPKK